ncbi:MAG: hypothetical protein EOO08_05250 [Chitinophagaceae bacterium]|nr:MAG: hypothetical protein EOO08_05250 [Chitinophagaceae bacterium]
MRFFLTALGIVATTISFAQSPVRFGLFGGVSQYQGDLQSSIFQGRFARPAIGLTASYDLGQRLALRGGITFSSLEASDRYNSKEELRARNLSFASKLTEGSLVAQYTFFNLDEIRWSPYVFGGVALFHFNPYTYDTSGQKYFLSPLSTEGQGLQQYPDRKMYSLTQFAIPFGAGVTYAITDRWQLGLEVGLRKTFTDYIDDVSGTYADAADLQATRGSKAVELAFRGNEVDPAAGYPAKGAMRGNAKNKDLYYFAGLHLQFRLGGGGGGGSTRGYGCPKGVQ